MKKVLLVTAIKGGMIGSSFAQNKTNWWRQLNDNALTKTGKNVFERNYQPDAYKVFQLDEINMAYFLNHTPSIKKTKVAESGSIITVPVSDGTMESFRVVEFSVMSDELQAKYPDIRAYTGEGITHPGSVIRFDMTPLGFHAMIISPDRKTIYINPVDREQKYYIVFDRVS